MDLQRQGTAVAFLYVGKRERALGFYRDTLGLALRSSDPYGDFLDLGGALIRMTVMPDRVPGPHPVLGWDVADISGAVDALAERGIAFITYEGMGQDERGVWTSPDGGARIAFFADPEGNVLSLSQTGGD